MGIFNLPEKEKRKPSKYFFQKLNASRLEWISEPDYYICYRVGTDMRVLTLFFAAITLTICYFHQVHGYFQWSIFQGEDETLLAKYLRLINFTGPVLIGSLIPYYLWFFKEISFDEYNFLRQEKEDDRKVKGQDRKY